MAKVWKKLQRADSDFTGNVTGTFGSKSLSAFYRTDNKPTKSDVGLGNIDNSKFDSSGKFKGELIKTDGTSVFNPSTGDFTGKIDGTDASTVKSKAEDAKDAIDGNKAITMVGGSLSIGTQSGGIFPFSVDSSGNLKIQNDEFQALADGTVNCKGNFTINQDSNGDSKIVLVGDNTGTAECEVQGANPTFDLGGSSPLGTSTLFLRRGGTGNQARILFQTGTTNKFGIGVSHTVDNDQFWIHNGNGFSNSSPHPERVLSFDPDGKTGFFSNSKSVAGFTFGSDGTNKHVYIKSGGLGIGTTSITDNDLNVQGTTILNGDVTMNNDLDVSGSATFQGETQFDDATTGISYGDLSNRPTIPYNPVGTTDKIFFTPADFIANDDQSYFNYAMVDNGAQGRVMSSSLEAYANILIPQGYKCTHVRVNGTSSVQVHLYYSDTGSSTVTSAQITTLFTNGENSVNPSSGIAATSSGRYMVIKWNPTSTSHRLYGGYIKIASI